MGIRLTVGFTALLLMMASLAAYSSMTSRTALADNIGLASEAIAETLVCSVDRILYLRAHEALTVVNGNEAASEVESSNAVFDAMEDPQAYIDLIDENWTSASPDEIPESMAVILESNLSLLLKDQLVTHYLDAHGAAVFEAVILTNKYGAIIAATNRPSDYGQGDEAWWQNAVSNESELYYSDVKYDEDSGTYGVCTCTPVRDDAGEIIGVARTVINILTVAKDVELTELGYETSELKITTSDGRLIFSSRAYVMLQDVSSSAFFERATDLRGHFIEEEGGSNRLFSYVTSTGHLDYQGNNWFVFLSHSEDEVLGPATELQMRILIVTALALVFGAVVAVALSRSITRPLAALETATRALAKGNMDQRITVTSTDELGQLAGSFNEMVAELNQLYLGLDGLVKERTKDLEAANSKLGVLASITRHDALNQIAVQKGWLEMAMGKSKDPVINDYLRKVEASTDRLVSFLTFTRDYEEIGSRGPEWVRAQNALSSAILGLDLARVSLNNKLGDLEVLVDPMFHKVLHNVIANSLKHGEKVTTISLSSSEGPGGLTIVMEDDGVGIPENQKDRLFQREQFSGGRSHGLFLAAEILRMTRISIRENGTPGQGARFEMLVPTGNYRWVAEPRETPSAQT